MIYLDNAATSGNKPKAVIEAVLRALTEFSANPGRSGHKRSLAAAEKVYDCRSKLCDLFDAGGPQNVIFTNNCTSALNMVIKGVLNKNDHVVISSLEHNSVVRPVETLRRRGLITYDVAEVILGDDEATVRSFEKCITSKTCLVICTHSSNVLGLVMPIKKIGQLCKSRNVLFCVDAAQSAGVLPISMKEMNIDYLCVAPHKGLYAPTGIGVLVANKPIAHTIIEGGTGSMSEIMIQPTDMPEGFESGTLNLPGIFGVSAGVSFVNKIGLQKIYEHELSLMKFAYEKITKIKGIQLYTPYPEKYLSAPVMSFNLRHKTSFDVAASLDEMGVAVRAGLHCAPFAHKRIGTLENGTVRISPSYFTKKEEIQAFISKLAIIAR